MPEIKIYMYTCMLNVYDNLRLWRTSLLCQADACVQLYVYVFGSDMFHDSSKGSQIIAGAQTP